MLFGSDFWVDDAGKPLSVPSRDGTEVWVEGMRFKWVRNEFGALYKRSLGQNGYHLAPTYTLQQYIAQAEQMAREHVANYPPEVMEAVGNVVRQQVFQEQLYVSVPAPLDDGGSAGGAIFI